MHPEIVRVAIHPAIGVARVGNSPGEYFLAPEIPGEAPSDRDDFRDPEGRIKRQGVRFRIFGLDEGGNVVREITADQAKITWTVHVANKKSAWYQFNQALDIPASQSLPADAGMGVAGQPLASFLRNYDVIDRGGLVIDPGPRSISGTDANADGGDAACRFDTGSFQGVSVYLGEVRTDRKGRLVFLGGHGKSGSPSGAKLTTFANNDGWHDDISDGSVDATVEIGGRVLQAEGAWVVVAPPDFAPGVPAVVTGHDLLFAAAVDADPSLKPARPSFSEHIYPLLWRMTQTQWVNAGFARDFGWQSRYDFSDPDLIARLADPSTASWALRQSIASQFRDADYDELQANAWPAYYGDALVLNASTTDPREWMAVLPLQAEWISQWAQGSFEADWDADRKPPSWQEMTPAQQAAGLDKAALEWTLGGPFHPGCEFTWPMRHAMMYSAPFRIKRRTTPEPAYGDVISPREALSAGGPLDGSLPGDITRWMAVPWLTDTSSCLSAYVEYYGDYLPTFWPARVPNDVLTAEGYQTIRDPEQPLEDRQEAFAFTARKRWLRDIVYPDEEGWVERYDVGVRLPLFIKEWYKTGIIVAKPGPSDTTVFPAKMWVETGRAVAPITVDEKTTVHTDTDAAPMKRLRNRITGRLKR